jgi:uncharacterized protein (DUF58 family)
MLWSLAIILILLWALGLATSYTLGGFVHVLVGVAVVLLLVRIVLGRDSRGGRHVLKG